MNNYDELLDLDAEGLDAVSVEWLPLERLPGPMTEGGNYVITLTSAEIEHKIVASHDQLKVIRDAINKEIDGNQPRQEFLEWIDVYWDVVTTTTSQGKSEDEDEDEDERCRERTCIEEAMDEWGLLCHERNGQDPLPAEVCRTLGIPEGSTDAAATTFIEAAIDKAWNDRS